MPPITSSQCPVFLNLAKRPVSMAAALTASHPYAIAASVAGDCTPRIFGIRQAHSVALIQLFSELQMPAFGGRRSTGRFRRVDARSSGPAVETQHASLNPSPQSG